MSECVRYVVVVHGIGEQRKNETILSVVSRFAEACRGQAERESYDVVTLGSASSQTGKEERRGACRSALAGSSFQPWLEFEGISGDGVCPPSSFLGKPAGDGTNLRFADLCWSDLMQEDYPCVGQPPELWADGLLGRLWRKREDATRRGSEAERPPAWALDTLGTVRESLLLLYKLLGFRTRALRDTVFVSYLGDVQLYGEYLHLRGRAVRRFHRLMSHIEQWHWQQERERVARGEIPRGEMREPRYTVLAHSLGTVVAMDALLYAHASPEARIDPGQRFPNFPFPGYLEGLSGEATARLVDHARWSERLFERYHERTTLPGDEGWSRPAGWPDDLPVSVEGHLRQYGYLATAPWVRKVDSLVTLGSPIDKYLTLWWQNYEYLTETDWIAPGLAEERKVRKIRHFNYCDEQDPIGHNLDVAQTAEAFEGVFEVAEDLVYNRFPVPGLAHTSYWQDLPLFERILRRAVRGDADEGSRELPADFVFQPSTYRKILSITYKWIPYSVVLAGLFALTLAWYSPSWHVWPVASLALAAILLVGRRLLDLTVAWRQILRRKSTTPGGAPGVSDRRKRSARAFRFTLPLRAVLYLLATGAFGGLYVAFEPVPWSRVLLVPLVALLGVVVVGRVGMSFAPRRDRTPRPREATGAVEPAPAAGLLGGYLPGVYLAIAAALVAAVALAAAGLKPYEDALRGLWWEQLVGVLGQVLPDRLVSPLVSARHAVLFALAAGSGLAAAVFGYLNWRFWRTKWWFRRHGSEARQEAGDYRAYHHGRLPLGGGIEPNPQPPRPAPRPEPESGGAIAPATA